MLSIDVYSLPHKALRAALGEAGTALGAADVDAVAAGAELAIAALDELSAHGQHEDEFIQPIVERLLPEIAGEIAVQHASLTRRLDAVRRQLDWASDEPTALAATYRSYQRLLAQNLGHLDYEESVVLPALWLAMPESELADLMARFRAAHPDAVELYWRHANAFTATERTLTGAVS